MSKRVFTKEHRLALSRAHKGQIPTNLENLHKKNKGKNHGMWKGNTVGYRAIHDWVYRWKQKPEQCERCETKTKKLGWANIDHKYTRDLNKYIALCRKCHWYYDFKKGFITHINPKVKDISLPSQ